MTAAVRDVDVYIEQPCTSYEECLSVRRHTDRPFVLDESIDGIDTLLRGHADLAMDVVNIKIGKFGGLSRARQARDLCLTLGIAMTWRTPGAATSSPRRSRTWRTARRPNTCSPPPTSTAT